MRTLHFIALLITTTAASGCASREARQEARQDARQEARQEVQPVETTRAEMTVTRVSRLPAGTSFTPLREENLSGGLCRSWQMPAPGVVAHSATFPNQREPQTLITIIVDATGKIVRYSENRGLPRPNRDLAAAQAENASLTRTHIQLDYITGEALASNYEGGSSKGMIMGSVKEFEANDALGDLAAKADMVRRLCATGR